MTDTYFIPKKGKREVEVRTRAEEKVNLEDLLEKMTSQDYRIIIEIKPRILTLTFWKGSEKVEEYMLTYDAMEELWKCLSFFSFCLIPNSRMDEIGDEVRRELHRRTKGEMRRASEVWSIVDVEGMTANLLSHDDYDENFFSLFIDNRRRKMVLLKCNLPGGMLVHSVSDDRDYIQKIFKEVLRKPFENTLHAYIVDELKTPLRIREYSTADFSDQFRVPSETQAEIIRSIKGYRGMDLSDAAPLLKIIPSSSLSEVVDSYGIPSSFWSIPKRIPSRGCWCELRDTLYFTLDVSNPQIYNLAYDIGKELSTCVTTEQEGTLTGLLNQAADYCKRVPRREEELTRELFSFKL